MLCKRPSDYGEKTVPSPAKRFAKRIPRNWKSHLRVSGTALSCPEKNSAESWDPVKCLCFIKKQKKRGSLKFKALEKRLVKQYSTKTWIGDAWLEKPLFSLILREDTHKYIKKHMEWHLYTWDWMIIFKFKYGSEFALKVSYTCSCTMRNSIRTWMNQTCTL